MPEAPSDSLRRLSLLRLAWRHLESEKVSAVALAAALLLALLPAGLAVVEGWAAESELRATVTGSKGFVVEHPGVDGVQAFDSFQSRVQVQVRPRAGAYLDGGSEQATVGPLRIASVNVRPASGAPGAEGAAAMYVADLAARVEVLQGQLATGSAPSGDGTVSIPEIVADRLALKLSDVVCLGAPVTQAAGAAQWCARVVGLWRPTAAADPGWTAPNTPLAFFTDRDELFSLAYLQPSRTANAARYYRPAEAAMTPDDASGIAQRLRDLRASLSAAGIGQVRSSLDSDLERYATDRRPTSYTSRLLAASLAFLAVLLTGVLGRGYLESRLRDVGLLRFRGWSPRRVRRLVLLEFAMVAAPAVAIALWGSLALIWHSLNGPSPGGPALASGQRSQLGWIGGALGAPLLAAVGWLITLAWSASLQRAVRLDHREVTSSRLLSWRGTEVSSLLILPAALLLLLRRLVGIELPAAPSVLDDFIAVLMSVAALVLLAIGLLDLMSRASEAVRRRRSDLEATLARWQLRRGWQRNTLGGLLIVLAFPVATFAAVGLAAQALGGSLLRRDPFLQADTLNLTIGFVAAVTIAMTAYGLIFWFVCRLRMDDYAALLMDGLALPALRRSLRIEQHAVLSVALVVGVGLGLVLVWANLPDIVLPGRRNATTNFASPVAVVVGAVCTTVTGVLVGAIVAWLVRRRAVSFSLLQLRRRGA